MIYKCNVVWISFFLGPRVRYVRVLICIFRWDTMFFHVFCESESPMATPQFRFSLTDISDILINVYCLASRSLSLSLLFSRFQVQRLLYRTPSSPSFLGYISNCRPAAANRKGVRSASFPPDHWRTTVEAGGPLMVAFRVWEETVKT